MVGEGQNERGEECDIQPARRLTSRFAEVKEDCGEQGRQDPDSGVVCGLFLEYVGSERLGVEHLAGDGAGRRRIALAARFEADRNVALLCLPPLPVAPEL